MNREMTCNKLKKAITAQAKALYLFTVSREADSFSLQLKAMANYHQ